LANLRTSAGVFGPVRLHRQPLAEKGHLHLMFDARCCIYADYIGH
jgi:hypothetical protein